MLSYCLLRPTESRTRKLQCKNNFTGQKFYGKFFSSTIGIKVKIISWKKKKKIPPWYVVFTGARWFRFQKLFNVTENNIIMENLAISTLYNYCNNIKAKAYNKPLN